MQKVQAHEEECFRTAMSLKHCKAAKNTKPLICCDLSLKQSNLNLRSFQGYHSKLDLITIRQ